MMKNKTKKALAYALIELLNRKPLTKITIGELAQECGISRMTFYYHFHDIYDLLQWTCEEEARGVIGEYRSHNSWQEGFEYLLNAARTNQSFVLNVYHSASQELVELYINRMVEHLLLEVVEEQSSGLDCTADDKRRVATFYTYAFVGVVMEWVRMGMITPPEQVVKMTAAITQGDVRNALINLHKLGSGGKAGA